MNIICSSFGDMAERIRAKRSEIVLFGAGVLGRITAPQILERLHLLPLVRCCLDNDCSKWGEKVDVCGTGLAVRAPAELAKCGSRTALVVCVSRFFDVVRQLEAMECTRNMDCYILAMLCVHNFCSQPSAGVPIYTKEALIPKKLHYMWFGGNPIPEMLKTCMESWKRYCPDYEIIRWDESNYDVEKHPYMKEAYAAGAYGFVPDYARLDILYAHGGIYLDTDVELLRNLDTLLHQEAFCGVEKWQTLNFGGCSGAAKGSPAIKTFLEARKDIRFFHRDGRENRNTCGFYDTRTALAQGYKINGRTQTVGNMNVYAYDYFHPYDYMSERLDCTEHTYSVHWFNGGWLTGDERKGNACTFRMYDSLYQGALRLAQDEEAGRKAGSHVF